LCKHPPVLIQKKVLRPQMLDRWIQRVVVQQNRAKHRAFRIQIIR